MMKARNSILGYVLAATALVARPCHLPLTLPIVLGLLGGTVFGAAITAHTGLLVVAATLYFVVALGAAFYLLYPSARGGKENRRSKGGGIKE
jgi:hypothetical protein